jgi:hypothetical protein
LAHPVVSIYENPTLQKSDFIAVICFEAIGAYLAEAGMSFADIVPINGYVTDLAHML